MPSITRSPQAKYWRVPSATSVHGRRPDRVFGVIVIAPRRTSSAHLRQPRRATCLLIASDLPPSLVFLRRGDGRSVSGGSDAIAIGLARPLLARSRNGRTSEAFVEA